MERTRRIWLRTLIMMGIIGLVALFWSRAHAATFSYGSVSNNTDQLIELNGQIVDGDAARLEAMLRDTTTANGRPIVDLTLNSPGGTIGEAIKIANVMRAHQLGAVVRPEAKCVGMLHPVRGRSSQIRKQ